jgi:antitoxin component YwqK of YwqJK toxin-antitoxin module
MGHQLTIRSLPAKLPSDLLVIKISYPNDLTNNSAFYKMGQADFYLSRKNAFRVNRCRLSGRIEGYDNAGDKRYTIDFRRGKLDGSFTVYRTNGKVEIQVYSNGHLRADVVKSKKEKMNR